MNVGAVRQGLADALAGLDIRSYEYAPDAPNVPAAFIYPDPFAYHDTFDDGADARFCVRLIVSSTAMQDGQSQLDRLISSTGTGSAVAAIESDTTLGGVVDSCVVTNLRNYGILQLPDNATRYLSAELLVSVIG